jgi:cytochrome P450
MPSRSPAEIKRFLNELVFSLYAFRPDGSGPDRIGKMTVIDHPLEVDTVVKAPDLYRKNFSLISALGFSRFNTDGDDWAVRRSITQPAYLDAARPARQPDVYRVYAEQLAEADASFEAIQEAMFAASLRIFHQVFSAPVDIPRTTGILDRVRTLLRSLQYFSWAAPTAGERDQLLAQSRDIVADFAAHVGTCSHMVAVMDRFRQAAGGLPGFSPVEELIMNLFAGVETTVATSLWVIDRLGANADVQQRIYDELSSSPAETPLTDCFINETMRYFPPIPFLIREVADQTTLGDKHLRQGQLIVLSIVGIHHHRQYWASPGTFDSRRPEFLGDTYDKRAFIPFLAGPRMCGGARLGRLEVKEAVRAFVLNFIAQRQNNVVAFDYALALRPGAAGAIAITRR